MSNKEQFFDLDIPDHVIKEKNREVIVLKISSAYSRNQLSEEEVRKKLNYMGMTPREADNAMEFFNAMKTLTQPYLNTP